MPRALVPLVRLALSNDLLYTKPSLSRLAISLSAAAISRACARLSIAHGPAIRASGKALPNDTPATLTTGFGADVRALSFIRSGPCGAVAPGSTGRREDQGCSQADRGTDDDPAHPHLGIDPARLERADGRGEVVHGEAQGREPRAAREIRRGDGEMGVERGRSHDFDDAARRRHRDPGRRRRDGVLAHEGGEEGLMLGRV